MRTLELLVQPEVTPEGSAAANEHFLRSVRDMSDSHIGVLRVYACDGDLVSLGRYHSPPPARGSSGRVRLARRHSGGRVVPCGEGFVGFALVLRHRSALVSATPLALAPHQVINRCVRGLLEGCRAVGVPAFYPGRDLVTVDHRAVAMVSFEVDATGALLFEGVMATARDFAVLPEMLAVADPGATATVTLTANQAATSLRHELGVALTVEEVAEVLRRGYQQYFDVAVDARDSSGPEMQVLETAVQEFDYAGWMAQRQVHPGLLYHASEPTQLGMLQAHLAVESDGLIHEVLLCGDFIADSPAIDELQDSLRMCRGESVAIDAVVTRVFSNPDHYILGIPNIRTLSDVIMKALPS